MCYGNILYYTHTHTHTHTYIYIYIWGVFCEFRTILLSPFVINKLNIKVRSRHHLEATRISWCICSWCQNKICIHQRKLLSKCIYISFCIDVLAGNLGEPRGIRDISISHKGWAPSMYQLLQTSFLNELILNLVEDIQYSHGMPIKWLCLSCCNQ